MMELRYNEQHFIITIQPQTGKSPWEIISELKAELAQAKGVQE